MHVDEGPIVELDRWQISVWPNDKAPQTSADSKDRVKDVPIHVVNNYFSIGADAQVTLEFHLGRGTWYIVYVYVLYMYIVVAVHSQGSIGLACVNACCHAY